MKGTFGLGLLCCLAAFGAKAGCTPAGVASPASYGTISSTLVRTAAQSTSSSNAGLTCTAGGIALLSDAYFKATITSSRTGMLGPTGDVIAYTIYANNSTAHPMTRGQAFDFAVNGLLGTSAPSVIPLYFTTAVNNVAAGVYTETLNVRWDWSYCTGLGALGICLGYDTGSNRISTLTVSMTVANDCTISAPSISFGSAPVVSAFSTVSQTISVNCTKGSAYTVGLGDGTHPISVGGRRRMISGSNYLAYDIFQSAGSTRWGSVGAARRASSSAEVFPGNGLGNGSQIFNYNAKIYTDQTTPPAGSYTDNVVLDVGF